MTLRVGSALVALLVLALPLASFLLLALIRPLRRSAVAAATVSITAMAAAVGAAFWLSWRALPRVAMQTPSTTWAWIPADGGPMATVGVMVDDASMAMCRPRSYPDATGYLGILRIRSANSSAMPTEGIRPRMAVY